MLEFTVVTFLCSEVSNISPTVNCIFHKYQTFRDNYCKAFGCLKACLFVNGTNSKKQTWNKHALFVSLCHVFLKTFFTLHEFKTSLNNHCFSCCLKNLLLSALHLVIKLKISDVRHFLKEP